MEELKTRKAGVLGYQAGSRKRRSWWWGVRAGAAGGGVGGHPSSGWDQSVSWVSPNWSTFSPAQRTTGIQLLPNERPLCEAQSISRLGLVSS